MSDEPVRRPDRVGTDPRADKWIFLAVLGPVVVIGWLLYPSAEEKAAAWRQRFEQHNLQMRACLDTHGVPYFDDRGLFKWCQK